MAIALAGASNGRVDFGDVASLTGLKAFSISIVINVTATPNTDQRLASQWGALNTFLLSISDDTTDELGFVVSDAVNFFGMRTSALNMTTGLYRIAVTIQFGTPTVIRMWVNGVEPALETWVGAANIASMIDSAEAVQVGHQTAEVKDGLEGEYSEFAIWGRALLPAEAIGITGGLRPPQCYASNGLVYLPMLDTTDLIDRWSRITGALTDGSNATHPTLNQCVAASSSNRLRPNPFAPGFAR